MAIASLSFFLLNNRQGQGTVPNFPVTGAGSEPDGWNNFRYTVS